MADTLNTAGDQVGQSAAPEGHDQAMIDKVNQVDQSLQQQQQQTQQTDEPLLGKFGSVEELSKAYKELEQKLGQQGSEQQTQKPTGPVSIEQADELIEKAGLDMDAVGDYFRQHGGLSEEHYADLEKAGVPRETVDQFIRGVVAEGEQLRSSLMDELGGEETFTAMASWAKANLSPAEIAAYNDTMEDGEDSDVRSAVLSLAYRYQKAVGSDPQLLNGNGSGGGGYESITQLTEAMGDPRYHKDPAYRKEVERKLARSSIF